MTNYNTIRRGPMGGDQYTQIHNYVFRDKRLKPIDMAVLGHISTHVQGWSTSAAKIADDMGIGESAVRASLVRLKDHFYLIQDQDRDGSGRVGSGWYFITDLPAQLGALGIFDPAVVWEQVSAALAQWLSDNRRSAPVCAEAYRPRPAETKPKRVFPKSLRKSSQVKPVMSAS